MAEPTTQGTGAPPLLPPKPLAAPTTPPPPPPPLPPVSQPQSQQQQQQQPEQSPPARPPPSSPPEEEEGDREERSSSSYDPTPPAADEPVEETEDGSDESRSEKRKMVARELVQTEMSYLAGLKFVVEQYLGPAREGEVLSAEQVEGVFGNVEELVAESEDFLSKIEPRVDCFWSDIEGIGDTFSSVSRMLECYSRYTAAHGRAITTVTELLGKRQKFAELCAAAKEHPESGGRDLFTLLITPVQRLLRYSLLLKDYLKHTPEEHPDRALVVDVLALVEANAQAVNASVKREQNREKLAEIEKTFVNLPKDIRDVILSEDHMFVRTGPLTKICRKSNMRRQFWLFSDVLMYGSATPKSGLFVYHRHFSLDKIRIKPVADAEGVKNGFMVITTEKSFTVMADTTDEKDFWVMDINELTMGERLGRGNKDSLYIHEKPCDAAEAPVWIPDKQAKRCMICADFFTVIKRRHHCFTADRHQILTNRGFLDLAEFEEAEKEVSRARSSLNAVRLLVLASRDKGSPVSLLSGRGSSLLETIGRLLMMGESSLRVASFDPLEKQLAYSRHSRLVATEDEECRVVEFSDEKTGFSLVVTPEHRMYAKLPEDDAMRVYKAKDLCGRSCSCQMLTAAANGLRQNAKDELPFATALRLESQFAFLRLFGHFLTTGCTRLGRFAICLRGDSYAESLLLRAGLSQFSRGQVANQIVITEPQWVRFFSDHRAGVVPHWVWDLGGSLLRELVFGLTRRPGPVIASTERFRDDVVRAFVLSGLSAQYARSSCGKFWEVRVSAAGSHSVVELDLARGVRVQTYRGRTWCVTVPSGLIVVRRKLDDGTASPAVICGNCRNCGKVICGNCSMNRRLIPNLDVAKPVRVCSFCHDFIDIQEGKADQVQERAQQRLKSLESQDERRLSRASQSPRPLPSPGALSSSGKLSVSFSGVPNDLVPRLSKADLKQIEARGEMQQVTSPSKDRPQPPVRSDCQKDSFAVHQQQGKRRSQSTVEAPPGFSMMMQMQRGAAVASGTMHPPPHRPSAASSAKGDVSFVATLRKPPRSPFNTQPLSDDAPVSPNRNTGTPGSCGSPPEADQQLHHVARSTSFTTPLVRPTPQLPPKPNTQLPQPALHKAQLSLSSVDLPVQPTPSTTPPSAVWKRSTSRLQLSPRGPPPPGVGEQPKVSASSSSAVPQDVSSPPSSLPPETSEVEQELRRKVDALGSEVYRLRAKLSSQEKDIQLLNARCEEGLEDRLRLLGQIDALQQALIAAQKRSPPSDPSPL